jgi:hypothetical protein
MKGKAMEADHKRASSSAPPAGGVTNPFEDSGPEAPAEPCEPGGPSFPFEDSGPDRRPEPPEPRDPSFPFEDSGPERSRAR